MQGQLSYVMVGGLFYTLPSIGREKGIKESTDHVLYGFFLIYNQKAITQRMIL